MLLNPPKPRHRTKSRKHYWHLCPIIFANRIFFEDTQTYHRVILQMVERRWSVSQHKWIYRNVI